MLWNWMALFMSTMMSVVTEEVTGDDVSEIGTERNDESGEDVIPENEVEDNDGDDENAITVTDISNMVQPSAALHNDQEICSGPCTGEY
jgi:hypothetical protein